MSSSHSVSVQDILELTGGRLANAAEIGDRASGIRVERLAPLAGSTAGDIAFFFAKEFQSELPNAHPSVLLTGEPFTEPLRAAKVPLWTHSAVIACADPYLAMALVSGRMAETLSSGAHTRRPAHRKIHPTAVVDASAEMGDQVEIGAHAVIEAGVRIGAGTVIYPGCYLGKGAHVGMDCVLFPRVTVYEASVIGDRVRIHAGAVIGADGFGYAPRKEAGQVVGHQKIYHVGRVVLGDDVEIGANACVDRGTFGDTRLGNQVKIDNHVQIGHNCTLDEGAVVCGSSAMAGSSSLGKFVYVGGLTGITNKVHVGDRASVAAMSLLTKDVRGGSVVAGNPQREYREHFKVHAALNRLVSGGKKPQKD